MSAPTVLRHGRVDLALHTLRDRPGRWLLLLHGLGEATPTTVPDAVASWPGPVAGLDFTGHGASTVPVGGGYWCEVLLADVDTALRHLGEATLVGRGLGGYVGLLAAGARPRQVRGVAIADGPGMTGGGPVPINPVPIVPVGADRGTAPDPFALLELSRDVRPPDYARTFAWQASALSDLDTPIAVCARSRPPWLAEVAQQPGVIETDLADALDRFA